MHVLKYQFAELKDRSKICIHLSLKFQNLMLCHLILWMIKYFLTQHLENVEIVLAYIHIFRRRFADIINEGSPTGVPFILHNLDQNWIALWQNIMQCLWKRLGRAVFQDEVNYIVFKWYSLIFRQC